MITAILNEEGNAVIGLTGGFVHFGGSFKVYRKPHSVRRRRSWAARWSTPTTRIESTELGFNVSVGAEVYQLGYNPLGFELLMYLMSKDVAYRKCQFNNKWAAVALN
jgi:hypothetical protein